jgi:Uma2 family endonuclease
MSTALKRRLLTEEEYLLIERQSEERSEYFRGEMFAMSGATRSHNVIAHRISRLLGNQLEGRSCDVYQSDMKVRVNTSGRFTYPDVVVVCGERQYLDERQDVLLNPTVLFEVLSESTANYDRGEKSRDYRMLGSLRDLLIVAQDQPLVEHHVRQDKNTWNLATVHGLDATIQLPSIGCTLPLADVFAGIEFFDLSPPALRVAEG